MIPISQTTPRWNRNRDTMTMQGNLRQVYEALLDRWTIGQVVGAGEVHPLMAEIVIGFEPAWYVLQVVPSQARIAAAHLTGRRFGIYAPELPPDRTARGRKRRQPMPLFPGYVFVFAWLNPRNYHRIKSCPGVFDFLCISQQPAVIPDAKLDAIRAVENKLRPLTIDRQAFGMVKKGRRGFRRFRKMVHDQQIIEDTQIIGVHTWSALSDGAMSLDGHARNHLLLQALGVGVA
jgi:transcription antitermination factor NusG